MVTATHPGPLETAIPAELVQALIDHARAGYPNEACGLLIGDRPAADGGRPRRFEADREQGGIAVPLRDRSRRPATA